MSIMTAETIIAPSPPLHLMSEAEFDAWCDEDIKAEYIDGEVIIMPPESTLHESGSASLGVLLGLFVKKNDLGWVALRGAIKIRLRKNLRRCPDTIFVDKARLKIVKDTLVEGSPDLVVEVVSQDSIVRDWHEKYRDYEAAGVREYWIVDQLQERLEVYRLGRDRRFHPIELKDGKLYSRVLPGFWVRPEWLWEGSSFDYYEMAKEIGIISI